MKCTSPKSKGKQKDEKKNWLHVHTCISGHQIGCRKKLKINCRNFREYYAERVLIKVEKHWNMRKFEQLVQS